jgi:hypothetical protein
MMMMMRMMMIMMMMMMCLTLFAFSFSFAMTWKGLAVILHDVKGPCGDSGACVFVQVATQKELARVSEQLRLVHQERAADKEHLDRLAHDLQDTRSAGTGPSFVLPPFSVR